MKLRLLVAAIAVVVSGCYRAGAPYGARTSDTPSVQPLASAAGVSSIDAMAAASGGAVVVRGGRIVQIGLSTVIDIGMSPARNARLVRLVSLADGSLLLGAADELGVRLFRSLDQGRSWSDVGHMVFPTMELIASLDIAATADVIIVLAGEQSSSAFSHGQLAQSLDGGNTWAIAPAPSGGLVSAAGGRLWLTGGANQDQVFVSNDGLVWKSVKVGPHGVDISVGPVADVPDGAVMFVTTHHGDEPSDVSLLWTGDGGVHWESLLAVSAPATATGSVIPTAMDAMGDWAIIYPDGSRVVEGTLVGRKTEPTVMSPNGLRPGAQQLMRAGDLMTVLLWSGDCPIGKDSCSASLDVLTSSDRGQTWNDAIWP